MKAWKEGCTVPLYRVRNAVCCSVCCNTVARYHPWYTGTLPAIQGLCKPCDTTDSAPRNGAHGVQLPIPYALGPLYTTPVGLQGMEGEVLQYL